MTLEIATKETPGLAGVAATSPSSGSIPTQPPGYPRPVFDFGAIPPEINSGRMYGGAGAGPLIAAAAAWDGVAAELSVAAAGYESAISELTSARWIGPTATAMAVATTPYMAWLRAVAGQAELAGTQAKASAAAFEMAHTMTCATPSRCGQPSFADDADLYQFAGAEHPGYRCRRILLRPDVGPRRRSHVHLRQLERDRFNTAPLHTTTSYHQPSRLDQSGNDSCYRHEIPSAATILGHILAH